MPSKLSSFFKDFGGDSSENTIIVLLKHYQKGDNANVNKIEAKDDTYMHTNSVAKSGRSSVIADHLGVLVGQNRCRFFIMTEHY